mmetsp:Transcript_104698/g.145968  ORF Transcript_104698/g.145968 Transcript_104698/m.145968 type:complete len:80 (+) Transcript_104698:143-382(+)
MIIESWDSFARQAEALVVAEPVRSRVTTKHRPSEAKVMIKVTDDRVCLQYVADSVTELKKILAFSANLNRHYLTADVTD